MIRKLLDLPCNGNLRRRQTAKTGKPVRLRLEPLEERLAPHADPTSCFAGNVNLNFYGHGHSPAFVIPVTVHDIDTGGVATSGTVTCSLVNGNTKITLGSADVDHHGNCNVHVNLGKLPDNLSIGSFHLEEDFEGDSHFASCSGSGSLTISALPTIIVPTTVIFNSTNTGTVSSLTISTQVNCSTTVSGGTVTFDLVAGNKTIQLGTATVGANGVATLTVTDQDTLQDLASLKPGHYDLVETFSGSGPFAACNATTTVSVNLVPTTTVVPSIVNVTVNNNTTYNITVNVNTPSGPATSGTVTLDLLVNGTLVPLGTATIGSNGTVTLTVNGDTISSLAPGQYQLVVNFNSGSGSPNSNSSTITTLAIQAPPSSTLPAVTTTTGPTGGGPGGSGVSPIQSGLLPMQAALELALDLAMLGNMANPGSVGELQMFSQVFLQRPVPTSIPALLSNIESLLPQAGSMLLPALGFAGFLDTDLPIENPMR